MTIERDTKRDTEHDMKPDTERATEQATEQVTEDDLRKLAVARLRKQADFRVHLAVYLAVNGFLVVIWALTNAPIFWPVFPIVGWGIAVAANAWDAYGREQVTEERIQREIDRMRQR